MINENHLQEWINSGVDEEIINRNVRSLEGQAPYAYLLYDDKLERRNDGRLVESILKRYQHIDAGGWWCSGVDPLNDYGPMEWGCFKPTTPRIEQKDGKNNVIKYEHPKGPATRVFLLEVPDSVWEKVSVRQNITIDEIYKERGFWYWVWKNNVPVVITEGAKKAGSLLSCGYAAIALPGVTGAYRNVDKVKYLIPDILHFATEGREFSICFDNDEKQKTVQQVIKITQNLGKLLEKKKCSVKIVKWSGAEKGIDDFVVSRGTAALHTLFNQKQSFNDFTTSLFGKLTYPASVTLNQKYIGAVYAPPGEKLLVLKSPKGTGKTTWFEPIVSEASREGQPVILLSHRIQLAKAICAKVGLPYASEIKDRSNDIKGLLGFGLCVDSLHEKSQISFEAYRWREPIVIIDEAEQVIWHLLNSNTAVKTYRTAIIKELKQLLINAIISEKGKIIISDADLSDVSINFIRDLTGINVKPWVLLNEYKESKRVVYNYTQSKIDKWLDDLFETIDKGHKVYVALQAQSERSQCSTTNLEQQILMRFPGKKVFRYDSDTCEDPNSLAYNAADNLDEVILRSQPDVFLASPSIETGVSIDIQDYFHSVWAVFQGVTPTNSARQSISRVRADVPRYIWSAPMGLEKIGNGATTVESLLSSEHQQFKVNLKLLQDTGMFLDIDELETNDASLYTWCKMGARINLGMIHYRDTILKELGEEGYTIFNIEDESEGELRKELKEVGAQNYEKECKLISQIEIDLNDPTEYDKLKSKTQKNKAEKRKERKYSLAHRYKVEVTPELIQKDDEGWYSKLRLHYFLTTGKEFLPTRDRKAAEMVTDLNNIWIPDLNRSQLGLKVKTLELLNLLDFVSTDRIIRADDPELVEFAEQAKKNDWAIKSILGIKINKSDGPTVVFKKFIGLLGLEFKLLKQAKENGKRIRHYAIEGLNDGRGEILRKWEESDRNKKEDKPQGTLPVIIDNKDINGVPNTDNPPPITNAEVEVPDHLVGRVEVLKDYVDDMTTEMFVELVSEWTMDGLREAIPYLPEFVQEKVICLGTVVGFVP